MPAPHTAREKIAHPATSSLDLATIMRTVGDPLRLDIVRLLADDRPRPCSEVSTAMGLPVSTCRVSDWPVVACSGWSGR